MDVCVELAKNLTAQYLSASLYDGVSPLGGYLAHTGVLVSMCVTPQISHLCLNIDWDGQEDHWSGSWLQHSTTGPGITGIGMVMNGQLAADDILCLYPLDGSVHTRSQQGCGPSEAPRSGWIRRRMISARVYWTKMKYFGISTKWKDISCTNFFKRLDDIPVNDNHLNIPVLLDQALTWGTYTTEMAKWLGWLIGKAPPCFDDSTPNFADGFGITYIGEPWTPSQWRENAEITRSVIAQHPTIAAGSYNEIVMKTLSSKQALTARVQAIFYTDEADGERAARAEAANFGGIPVLKLDASQPAEFFITCPVVDPFHAEQQATID
jgi:hypothetical protein